MRYLEVFNSIQGEGLLIGQPTTFVRFAGCDLRCVWCDTKQSWDKEGGIDTTPEQLLDNYAEQFSKTRAVCITGGEPMLQLPELVDFIKLLKAKRKLVSMETNGTMFNVEVTKNLSWISLSPKLPSAKTGEVNQRVIEDYLTQAFYKTQLKFVIKDEEDKQEMLKLCTAFYYLLRKEDVPIVIQPCDNDTGLLKELTTIGSNTDLNVRFLPQLHKTLNLR